MIKRNVLTSPRLKELKKKKRRAFQRKVFLLIVGLAAIIVILSYVSRNAKLNINTVEVSGNKIVDTEVIKNIANEKLAGYYLWFFPKTNFLLYPQNVIRNELTNKYKRLKDIAISIKNPTTLEISLTERIASYTWCGANLPESNNSGQKCYFLDQDGYIFDEAPYFSGEVYSRFYGANDLNLDNPTGSYFAKKIFGPLILFKETMEKMGLKPRAFYLLENGDMQMFLSRGATIPNDPKIIFKSDADFNKVAENLQAALTTEPLQTNFQKKYSSLLYIDLRFANKVLYKFQ